MYCIMLAIALKVLGFISNIPVSLAISASLNRPISQSLSLHLSPSSQDLSIPGIIYVKLLSALSI
jgi:hypothetical protein